tara:strand:+ start:2817 stop:3209 length:393 start_codon:yes stop_codon:yes gene_type:complete
MKREKLFLIEGDRERRRAERLAEIDPIRGGGKRPGRYGGAPNPHIRKFFRVAGAIIDKNPHGEEVWEAMNDLAMEADSASRAAGKFYAKHPADLIFVKLVKVLDVDDDEFEVGIYDTVEGMIETAIKHYK